jgi:hypothetical protein
MLGAAAQRWGQVRLYHRCDRVVQDARAFGLDAEPLADRAVPPVGGDEVLCAYPGLGAGAPVLDRRGDPALVLLERGHLC